jgi:hypothetical protein
VKHLLGLALSTIVLLAAPHTAQASLPKTTHKLIVPNKSIGGVALGDHRSQVTRAWGANAGCQSTCIYVAKAKPKPGEGSPGASALLERQQRKGARYKVWSVYIYVGEDTVGNKLVPNFKTRLTTFKTAKGIGLGSTVRSLTHTYHGLKKENAAQGISYYTLKGRGKTETLFAVSSPSHRIVSITIRSHPGG